jgi:hypothetical protein
VDSSRQLRFRVQPDGESNVSNSYVTDMGVKGADGSNYFFITAPQNTSNVGDQNTFVISTTSNVGIGTTDPEKPLHVVGDSWITGTLTASNIVGASPVTISSDLVMASGFTLTAGAIEPPTGSESNLKITGTLTTSNIVANTGDNLLVSSNLEVGTSNLFVDTSTGRIGIGTDSPVAKLDVAGSSASGKSLQLRSGDVFNGTDSSQIIFSYDGNPYNAGGYAHSIRTRHNSDADSGNAIDFWLWNTSDTANANTLGNKRVMTIEGNGNVGIGVTNPQAKLDVNGDIKINNDIKHDIPSVYSIYNVMSTNSGSPNTLFTGKSITMDRLFLAALDAVVVMDGAALGNLYHYAKPLRYFTITANTLEMWFSIYDGGTYEKAVIIKFTINSNNDSLTVYHLGSRYKEGIQYDNNGTWSTMSVTGYRVRYFRIVI